MARNCKNTEVRSLTMIAFMSDDAEDGHTAFPKLDSDVSPRFEDARVWSNVGRDIQADCLLLIVVDEGMVHKGKPPARRS
jgi:hypothetical protein